MHSDYPEDRLYHPDALWLMPQGDGEALIGINHHAQKSLGPVMFIDLPRVGAGIRQHAPLGTIESRKAVSDIIAPASGTVLAVNPRLRGEPALLNSDPYGEGWVLRMRLAAPADSSGLLAAGDYVKQLVGAGGR